ncbi:MBL fold metallo-hydrolase [Halobacterium bonnevillei]|uniref:MBL fold metallo-hydrolase n=1 Tax=Halobacterium bonnevillei TaxID=2692200 RepID=A0A6B0SQB4_9EURY|nr:MBL fold metallo-hydrolase [Halobacterium bonnevillei]MXR21723.1 MBL fold metallo-hydrolase [Halobacterium bonnevillei]
MAPGDVFDVEQCSDIAYVDTGMYDTGEYGSVYVVDADRPAIVDTGIGTNYERILGALDERGIARDELAAILVTHVHLDHAGGAGYVAEACPNADVYVHEIGAPHLVGPERLVEGTKKAVGDQWQHYVEPKPLSEDRIVELEDGDEVDLGSRTLTAHHVPGHAPHQVVYEDHADDAVFTADAAGIWVPSQDRVRETSPPPNFDLEQAITDVELIRRLDPDVLLYAHFGPGPDDVDAVLRQYEQVLRDWVETVKHEVVERGSEEAAIDHLSVTTDVETVWGEQKAREETAMNVRGVLHYLKTRENE